MDDQAVSPAVVLTQIEFAARSQLAGRKLRVGPAFLRGRVHNGQIGFQIDDWRSHRFRALTTSYGSTDDHFAPHDDPQFTAFDGMIELMRLPRTAP